MNDKEILGESIRDNHLGWAIALILACCLALQLAQAQQQQRSPSSQRQVRVYFPRDGNPHPRDPFNLQFVVREVAASAPARPALEALLAGPTVEEQRRRLRALDAGGLSIGALNIKDGTAHVNFVSKGSKRWAGDLSPGEFRRAVERTLKQFSTVRAVVVSVNGQADFDSQR